MKRTLRPVVTALATLSLSLSCSIFSAAASTRLAVVPEAPPSCVGGSGLNGWYGLLVSGLGSGARYLSGAVDFDGACGLSGSNLTGGIGGQVTTTATTGSYTQNADGTYNLTLNLANQGTPLTFVVGLGASGTKAVGIESDGTAIATIDIESQLTSLTNGYSNSDLAGTYSASCTGNSRVDLDYVAFDGKGNLSAVNPYDANGTQGNSSYSGTYSVNSDGTFSGALAGSYSQFTFSGVIENGVTQVQYTYNQSGSGEVEACSGRQAPPATLTGYYGMVVGGTATNGLGGQKELSGSLYFDGSGGVSATNLQGGINAQYGNTSATGTYVTNGDGTIAITLNLLGQATPQSYLVAVSESGNEAAGIETDGTAQATIDLQNQLVANGASYSNASLNGTYTASCTGEEVDLNYVTFDGNGNQTGVDPYDNGGYGNNPYAGTYTVNSDGTFSGGFSGAYSLYTMTGVIDNSTSEIEYTYGYTNGGVVSCVGFFGYGAIGTNPPAATPTLNVAPGYYNSVQTVALTSATPGAAIYYTVNGVTPTQSSLVYSNPISLSATTTIEAIAVASGYNNSSIAAGTYFIDLWPSAAVPTFNPAAGTYSSPQTVTLSDTTPGAVIHCTTDGSTPTVSSPVCTTLTVGVNTTIQALATASNYNPSAVATGVYTILTAAATPSFTPAPGTYSAGQTVTLSDATAGAVIHCTTDGTTPTASSPVCTTLSVNASTTIEALAVASGYNNSAVATGVYTILTAAATPSFTPAPGTYSAGQTVTLSDATAGAVIHCTTDGTTPTASSPVCTTLSVNASTTIEALAVASGYNNSAVATGVYTILTAAATPSFTPAPGTYSAGQTVTLSDATAGAVIHCTTDGTTPTASSPVCTTLSVNASTTIEALAVASGYNNSAVATGVYTILTAAATPSFTPAPGTYSAGQTVTLSDATAGAVIHCTTDGTTPTASSPVCTTLSVNASTTIEALAVASGYNNSAVATGVYTILTAAATPSFTPVPGTYSAGQTVTLSDATAGAVIHCTTDGTTPTASSPVCTTLSVNASTTIEALAVAAGYNNSAVATGVYTILTAAATPSFTPAPGTYSAGQTVTLSDATAGAVIHCTTDGTTPTASSPVCTTLSVNASTTIEALAVASGYNNSAVATGVYTITPTAATPTFSPAPGTYNSPQMVTFADATAGAVIHCTTDGTTPTAGSPVCTAFIVGANTITIEAIAVVTGYNNSAVATGVYTITPTAAAPTFSVTPGTYSSTLMVTLVDVVPGAAIHCTVNGAVPTAASPVCTTVTVKTTATIQAIAIATGYNSSAVASGVFTINRTAATPTFSPAPGNYGTAQTVTLSDTIPGAVIRYTTDGTTPTDRSPVYSKPFSVTKSSTIRAIAVGRSYTDSAVAVGVYSIGAKGAGRIHEPTRGRTIESPE